MEKHRHMTLGLFDAIVRCSYENHGLMSNLTREMKLFRKIEGDFSRVSAMRDHGVMLPSTQKLTSFLLMI